jgi:exodeoxyribonuclease VII small subunit
MQHATNEITSLSYEQAFAELEEIVYGLETNQKSLEEAIALFERGQTLAKYCASLLDQAELKVRQLSDLDEVAAQEASQEDAQEDEQEYAQEDEREDEF